jgi:hypothetical protein
MEADLTFKIGVIALGVASTIMAALLVFTL